MYCTDTTSLYSRLRHDTQLVVLHMRILITETLVNILDADLEHKTCNINYTDDTYCLVTG